jgi:hypothetical protein
VNIHEQELKKNIREDLVPSISEPSSSIGQPKGLLGKVSTGKRPLVVARKAGQTKNPPKKKKK